MFHATTLAGLPGVRHAFSGALGTPEEQHAFLEAAGPAGARALRLRQVHGNVVVRAEQALAAAEPLEGDALLATGPGASLVIATADCVPVLLVDPEARVAAAVHAGWRGMRSRILAETLERMREAGARPARLRAAIGPAVQGSCYVVGADVREEFERSFPDAAALFQGNRLDLVEAARSELAQAGVLRESIEAVALCTHCRSDLASFRRQGRRRGTNLSLIALGLEA